MPDQKNENINNLLAFFFFFFSIVAMMISLSSMYLVLKEDEPYPTQKMERFIDDNMFEHSVISEIQKEYVDYIMEIADPNNDLNNELDEEVTD